MSQTIAFIHTSPSMIPVFKPLAQELLKGVATFNMVDESLLCDIIEHRGCPPSTARRLVGHVLSAEQAGAQYILVTCSSMGPAVEAAQPLCGATVLRVDQPMAERAVATGSRIGVAATLPSTLQPTVDLIRRQADAIQREVSLDARVIEGAFEAVMNGQGETHDRLVAQAVGELVDTCDVVVLAQASMARVVDAIPAEQRKTPILSSPRLAVEYLADLLQHPSPVR